MGWFIPLHQPDGALDQTVSIASREMAPELLCFTACVIVFMCPCNLLRWLGYLKGLLG